MLCAGVGIGNSLVLADEEQSLWDLSQSDVEIAKELNNPATSYALLRNEFIFKTFTGDLPGADSQTSLSYIFQPSFPIPLENGKLFWFRPAIPLLLDQPVFNLATNDFDSKGPALGDISFDLAYGGLDRETGTLSFFGIFGSLPTGLR